MNAYTLALVQRECLRAHLDAAKDRGDTQAVKLWTDRLRRHMHKLMAEELARA